MILHLGVVDIPYRNVPSRRRKKSATVTTGDVAGFLEDKYHVMRVFFEVKKQLVARSLEEGMRDTLEGLLTGAPPLTNPFQAGASKIEDAFKQFIITRAIERTGIKGVPTKAARKGVSHRRKHAYAKAPRRPSFVDTGLYVDSFKAWVD